MHWDVYKQSYKARYLSISFLQAHLWVTSVYVTLHRESTQLPLQSMTHWEIVTQKASISLQVGTMEKQCHWHENHCTVHFMCKRVPYLFNILPSVKIRRVCNISCLT